MGCRFHPREARQTDNTNGVEELSPGLAESARPTLGAKPINPPLSRVGRRAQRVSRKPPITSAAFRQIVIPCCLLSFCPVRYSVPPDSNSKKMNTMDNGDLLQR